MISLRKIFLLLVQGIAALIGLLATFILIMLFIWPYIALLFSPFSFEEADIDGNGFISYAILGNYNGPLKTSPGLEEYATYFSYSAWVTAGALTKGWYIPYEKLLSVF